MEALKRLEAIVRAFVFAVACWIIAVSTASSATIVTNTNVTFGPNAGFPNANYASRVDQDVFGDYTGTWFEFLPVLGGYSMRVTQWNIDEEADWYLVGAGDSFSKAAIAADEFTPLFILDQPYPAVVVGSEFYLGVNTGIKLPDAREAFGWVRFQVIAGVLTMVENVMSYDSPGIIVGTTQVVPEPVASHLLIVGASFAFLKLRRY